MIYAEIHSKAPETQNREDVLTSNIFTLIKLLPDEEILQLLDYLLPRQAKGLIPRKLIKSFEFWKRIGGLKEPDIFIELEDGFIIIIEIKYKSGESSDYQLKDYLESVESDRKILIYLTADRIEPFLVTKKDCYKDLPIYWSNWFTLNESLSTIPTVNMVSKNIFNLLSLYLNYKKFTYFNGWTEILFSAVLPGANLIFYKSNA